MINTEKLKTSWTKYDAVSVIDIVSSVEEIEAHKKKDKSIDEPIFRSFLGINNLSDPLPQYWSEIQQFPDQKRLFALLAAIFTHYQNIKDFAEYSTNNMKGIFKMSQGKQYTNMRSALVESGASVNSDRRKDEVPYDFSPLYEKGEVGKLFKNVLENRLKKMDWDGNDFIKTCIDLNFHKALSLSKTQFENWINGNSLIESKLREQLKKLEKYKEIKAYKVNQWLDGWNDINFKKEEMREKPEPFFLMFKIDAKLLKRLSDVHRRSSNPDRAENDPSIQRSHKQSRSQEIHNYIHGGFPWSTLSKSQREAAEYKDFKMPGILPTAIIANILSEGSERGKRKLEESDRIIIENKEDDFPILKLPEGVFEEKWNPELKPIEIIDGQHRLWAFDEQEELNGNYELPVIAYYNLDRAWQAYLFYTINIKPVKINTSLGYDLYPLLRTQKWLEESKEGLVFYRENRAQELVEALWSYKESPWKGRIKMLGEGEGNITQAAFIKALTSSFLKKSMERSSRGMGGLFSDVIKEGIKYQVLNWNRSQQAAFLILLWDTISKKLYEFVEEETDKQDEPIWAKSIRNKENSSEKSIDKHIAFTSKNSFLSSDQGVRGISMFANDLFFSIAISDEWDLNELIWEEDLDEKSIKPESIDIGITNFKKHKIYTLIQMFAQEVIKLDWRTPSADFTDNPNLKLSQMRYKGGSGYSEVWKDLVNLFNQPDVPIELSKYSVQLKEFIK